jgi:chaperone modulatory protein CbpM
MHPGSDEQRESDAAHWLDQHASVTLTELVELSGLTTAEVQALVEHGVLVPVEQRSESLCFRADYVATARTAGRLQRDLGLDIEGLTLTLSLLGRIALLEDQIRILKAQLPRWVR